MAQTPRAKKAKVSQPKVDAFESSDPHELISQSREAAIKRMKSRSGRHEFSDLDIAIKTVRALIVTNEEIWNRCNKHYLHDKLFKMTRFDEIEVWNSGDETKIGINAKETMLDFDMEPLRTLPDCLAKFMPDKDATGIIDFKASFRESLVFHEDVLLVFLAQLKKHLERVQVCLGAIDQWVMDGADSAKFLEFTFDVTIDDILSKIPQDCTCHSNHLHGYHRYHDYASTNRCFSCQGKKVYDIVSFGGAGKVEQSFNISKEKDRAQLKRLVEYLKHV